MKLILEVLVALMVVVTIYCETQQGGGGGGEQLELHVVHALYYQRRQRVDEKV